MRGETGLAEPLTEPRWAAVAVPLPLATPLTYEVPEAFRGLAKLGVRARVRVGRQRVIGVVVDLPAEAPAGVRMRPLEEIVDAEPVFPQALLDLATFAADYYLAPIGEMLRTMLPGELPPWGEGKVRLSSGGALAPPRGEAEGLVIETLRELGRATIADLQRKLGLRDLPAVLRRLEDDGRILVDAGARRGARYLQAVDLAPGSLEDHLATCGRSQPAKQVVELLSGWGRPATVAEVTEEVGCTPAVVRRLVKLGVLRRFTQIDRLDLGHQILSGGEVPPFVLRPDQALSTETLEKALEERRFRPFLLHGMTGSGKTEVYLRASAKTLEQGRSVLLLVPEIALVPSLAKAAMARFGDQVAILHSALGTAERQQEWERIRQGAAKIVVGPRSALFAPAQNLGLLIVDEEQDGAYKQDVRPRYHGRDLALVRAQQASAVAVVVSATPSLESRLNAQRGKLELLRLTARVGQGGLPEGILVDLRKEEGIIRRPGEIVFSQRLRQEIEKTADAGDQIILLRNRRGYSPMLLCRACGEDHRCDDCGLARTYHHREGVLVCHFCGSNRAAKARCGKCGEDALEPIGAGTERVEETFRELFPGLPVDVLDRDAARRPGGAASVLGRFDRGETRVLIGTQMVSKGHHFPGVVLTAVLSADSYLGFPDFRAVERTYSLLTQLAGRAGRGEKPGRVVIQSFHPEHYAIQAALTHDDEAFAQEELRFREAFHYPPFTRMVQLLSEDKDADKARQRLAEASRRLAAHPSSRFVRQAGPAPAPFEKLRGRYRFQLLLRAGSGRLLKNLVGEALPEALRNDLILDVDPYQLL